MANLGAAAARGAGVTLGAQAARFALQILSLTVLARLLTPAQFGVVAMVTSVTGVAEIIRDFGLSSAAIQAKTVSPGERDNLLWVNVGIGTTCGLVVAAISPVLVALYGRPEVGPITLALAWLFVVSGFNTQYRADLSRSMRFGALATTDIGAQAAGIVAAIGLAWAGAGYWAIVAQQVVVVCLTCLLNVGQARWLPGPPRRDVSLRRFFSFGGSVFGTQVMGYALNNLDNVAIGAQYGAGPLGLYTRAYQLLVVPLQQINAPMSRVALPVLSRVQDDRVALQRFVDRFQLLSCYSLGLGFSVAAGLSVPLINVLFGPQWGAAAPIFALLAAGGVFKCFSQVPYQVFLATGLTGPLMRFYLVSRPVMLLVILAGLPWGPVGVATGHLVAAFGSWFAALWVIARKTGLDPRPQFTQSSRALLLVCAPAALVAYLVAYAIDATSVLQLLVGGLAALGWVVVIGLLVPPLRRDLGQVIAAGRLAMARGR